MNCRIAALGMVNALGSSKEEILAGLLHADQRGLRVREDFIVGQKVFVGQCANELVPTPPHLAQYDSRNTQLLLTAFSQIASEVSGAVQRYGSHRVGVVLGTSTSGIHIGEEAIRHHHENGALPKDYDYCQQEIGSVAEVLAEYAELGGPAYTVSTACSSSAKVFRSAQALLAMSICDAVIVGGADSLCRLTLNGFAALELISATPTNPCSKNRNGITIGEGACLMLMTREAGGIQLLGVGEASDAYHVSAPDPEASGAITAIRQALQQAQVRPNDIAYVNLHGTGTVHNDAMEAKALQCVFQASPACSSTKPLVGHQLGASGATEVGFCWLLLDAAQQEIALPVHKFDGEQDCNMTELRLVKTGDKVPAQGLVAMLSNSFGFGGSNCAVVIGRHFDASVI